MTSKQLSEAKHKLTFPNGRSAKVVPKAKNWFAQIPIFDLLAFPAWRSLTKTATDMAIIIQAKHSKAIAYNEKRDGRPVFKFTASEAVLVLGISRPTCTKAFKELKDKGFIDIIDAGGILFGKRSARNLHLDGQVEKLGSATKGQLQYPQSTLDAEKQRE